MNILNLKRAAAGHMLRAMVLTGVSDSSDGYYVDDGQPSAGLINTKAPNPSGKETIQAGQDEQGNPIWAEQDIAPKQGLKDSYATGQESTYLNDLSNTVHQSQVNASDSSDPSGGYTPATRETFTPEQAVELYNNMDSRLANDPTMASLLWKANNYYGEDGDFMPGGKAVNAKNFTDFLAQDKLDSEKKFAQNQAAGLAIVGGVAGGAMLGAGSLGGGGASLGAGGASGTSMGVMTAAEAASGSSALAGSLTPYLATPVAAGAGAAASAPGFWGSTAGKALVSQGIGAGVKLATGGGESKNDKPGLINSTQPQQQQQQPTVINYYGSGQQQQKQPEAPRPIASANGSMYGSGSGWGSSISTYQKRKQGS